MSRSTATARRRATAPERTTALRTAPAAPTWPRSRRARTAGPSHTWPPEPRPSTWAPPTRSSRTSPSSSDEELEDYDFEDEEQPVDGDDAYAPRGRRGDGEPDKKRPRVIQFLFNCWAELQRVEWPKRQQLITLTWVVIGFVIIAGSFLGLLDAIFSKLVQAFL